MAGAIRLHRYTYADYVGVEMTSSTKHEFLDGEIYAMAGGSADHAALALETLRALADAIGDRPCRAFTSDLRIYVESPGLATFPDGSVICGPVQKHPPGPEEAALNPSILLEVTSDSSEAYDTGAKLAFYKTIPSLRECILVSHRERRITVHVRGEGEAWDTRVAVTGGRVHVPSLQVDLVVDQIYRLSEVRC
jgi:Uma2 family endonuclease